MYRRPLARLLSEQSMQRSGSRLAINRIVAAALRESPSQHTAQLAPADVELSGKHIRKRDAVIAVMAAADRDPARFTEPGRLNLTRPNSRHVAFGWVAHFFFGAPLAHIEGQIAFAMLLSLALEPCPLQWRQNLGLHGLMALPVSFDRPVL